VTAETAVLLPALAMLLVLLLSTARVVGDQLAAQDAARVAARAAARGESAGAVEQLARQVAPPGASIAVAGPADLVRVRVALEVRPFGGALAWLPAITVTGSAVAAREPAPPGLP
jgi:Flp pilus assembly protein TadG